MFFTTMNIDLIPPVTCLGFVRQRGGGVLSEWVSLVRVQADGGLGDWVSFVREPADGALSSAAVFRCGLGPLPPPLCRCAKCTTDRLSPTRQVHHRVAPHCTRSQPWRLVWTAQRHKGGGHRPGDSRGAVHAKCHGEHSTRVSSHTVKRNQIQGKTQTSQHSEFRTAK
jgi:hypothetical protein